MVGDVYAVGPRELPDGGLVKVWIDSGSTSGQEVMVPVGHLQVAEMDDGQGMSATYALRVRTCQG
jgi:hypothetical protein